MLDKNWQSPVRKSRGGKWIQEGSVFSRAIFLRRERKGNIFVSVIESSEHFGLWVNSFVGKGIV